MPWIGSLVLVGYMVGTTDLDQVASSLTQVNVWAVLGLAVAGTAATFLVDSLSLRLTFNSFVCPITFRQTLPVKATSYFLNILNYNAALAGMALYLKKSRNIRFWKTFGSLMFLNVVDLVVVMLTLGFGLIVNLGSDTLPPMLEYSLMLVVFGGLTGFVVGLALFKSKLQLPFLQQLRTNSLFAPLHGAGVRIWVQLGLLRLAILLLYLVAQYYFIGLFGIHVPFGRMFVYLPVLTFIGIVPISISGLGTTQIAMRKFYAPYFASGLAGAKAAIDAASTTAILGFVFVRILLAYFFLGEFSREVLMQARSSEGIQEGDCEHG